MVLCVAGRSIDVDDHGGETSKPTGMHTENFSRGGRNWVHKSE